MNSTNESAMDTNKPFAEWWEQIPIGALSLLFFSLNISVAWTLFSLNQMHRHFCLLVLSLAIADCGVLATFTFLIAPLTLAQSSSTSVIGLVLGELSLFFYFVSFYAILAITLNRFLAVAFPFQYRVWVTTRNTVMVIGVCWGIGVAFTIPTLPAGCRFIYELSSCSWMWEADVCGQWNGLNLDLHHGAILGVCIFIINAITLIVLRHKTKRVRRTETLAEARWKKDIRFFVQSCLNALILEIMLVTVHFKSSLFGRGRWGLFVAELFWSLNHAANGLIFLSFNSDVRNALKKKLMCAKNPGQQLDTSHFELETHPCRIQK